eukprot:scaffold359957_cov15-Prasinocladus_malaysianus.AAC.1
MDGWKDGRLDGWMDRQTVGRLDKWIYRMKKRSPSKSHLVHIRASGPQPSGQVTVGPGIAALCD